MLVSLGIGIGSLLAGKFSGKHVELGLVPIGGLGLSIFCMLLYLYPSINLVIPIVISLGIFGGLYEVPIESFIQAASPEKYRGQMIATANFLAYFGVLCASALLYFSTNTLGLEARQGFFILTILTIITTVAITLSTLDYFLRFIAFSISRTFFRLSVNNPPDDQDSSSFVLCCQRPSSMIDTLLLTSIQRPPLRFFIESRTYENKFIKTICRAIRIILIPLEESEEKRNIMLKESKLGIRQGYKICIFTKKSTDEVSTVSSMEQFQKLLENTPHKIIPVSVTEKKPSTLSSKNRIIKKFPLDVTIGYGEADTSPKKEFQ